MANSKTGGMKDSDSALTRSPSPKRVTSHTPRMLTPSEIASLQQNKRQTAAKVKALLAATKPN